MLPSELDFAVEVIQLPQSYLQKFRYGHCPFSLPPPYRDEALQSERRVGLLLWSLQSTDVFGGVCSPIHAFFGAALLAALDRKSVV